MKAAAVAAALTLLGARALAAGLPLLPPPTQPLTVDMVVERVERLDRGLQSLSADFAQTALWQDSGVSQRVEGTVDYRKPDLLRIEHRAPERQTLVCDGAFLWIYRPSTEQVIKTRYADWKRSEPLAQGLLDFGHYAELLKSYDVALGTVSAPAPDGHRAFSLRLRPKQAEPGKEFALTLRMTTRDYFPASTELQAGGVTVHTAFSNIRYNPALADSRFRFVPPPGADVFDNVTPPKAR